MHPLLCLCLLDSLHSLLCLLKKISYLLLAVFPRMGYGRLGGTLQACLQQGIEAGVRSNCPKYHSHCMLTMLFVRCREAAYAVGCLTQVAAGALPCLHIALPA